jgi:hypothetical protein
MKQFSSTVAHKAAHRSELLAASIVRLSLNTVGFSGSKNASAVTRCPSLNTGGLSLCGRGYVASHHESGVCRAIGVTNFFFP